MSVRGGYVIGVVRRPVSASVSVSVCECVCVCVCACVCACVCVCEGWKKVSFVILIVMKLSKRTTTFKMSVTMGLQLEGRKDQFLFGICGLWLQLRIKNNLYPDFAVNGCGKRRWRVTVRDCKRWQQVCFSL